MLQMYGYRAGIAAAICLLVFRSRLLLLFVCGVWKEWGNGLNF